MCLLSLIALIEKETIRFIDWKSKKETIDLLLEKGLGINDTDCQKDTALTLLLKMVSSAKRNNVLTSDSIEADPDFMMLLSDVVSRTAESLNFSNLCNESALYIACSAQLPKTVKLLIESGCDLQFRCKDGNETVIHACCSGRSMNLYMNCYV